ncbi:alginate lyase family protein [Actinacidiphila glaucinigra]|uniref:alginate lyase family protein n=1 Tax=Actinacidiphila glaucinigra TaxID=235986 RepID=UPI002AFE2A0C|nr:alginate lyase family protein [Actinacidiphila glaucinigra]
MQDLARTRSRHCSTFNPVAFTRPAAVGDDVGVDLRRHTGPDGASLRRAVGFLPPAAGRHRRRALAPPRAGPPRLRRLRPR